MLSAVIARVRGMSPASMLAAFAWLVTIGFTLAIVLFTWRTNCFFGDDFGTFLMAREKPLLEALFAPLGHQIVPLHRALTLLLYALAPMSWTAVIVMLGAFHVLGIVYLYRTLELLAPTPLNALITAFYATNVLAGVQFTWFSSGTTRVPYIAFSLIAIYHYLRFCQSTERRHLVVVAGFYVLALGFYSKAIFIPLYCLAIDIAWRAMSAIRTRPEERAKWVLLALLIEFAPVYALGARSFLEGGGRATNFDPVALFDFVQAGLVFLVHSLAGTVLTLRFYRTTALLPAVWALFCLYSIVRSPRTAIAWLLGFLVVVLNIALVGVSNRGAVFGVLLAIEQRHYFELMFLIAIFLAIIAHRLQTVPELRALSKGTTSTARAMVAALLLSAYAATTYPRFREIAQTSPNPRACAYIDHVSEDLERIEKSGHAHPTFRDGTLPLYISGMDLTFRYHSQLFRVLEAPVVFRPDGRYRVRPDGHIERAEQP